MYLWSKRCSAQIAYTTNGQVGSDCHLPGILYPNSAISCCFHCFKPACMKHPYSLLAAIPSVSRHSVYLSKGYVVKRYVNFNQAYLCSWIHHCCIQVDRYMWSYLECLYRWHQNYNLHCLLHTHRYLYRRSSYDVTSVQLHSILSVIIIIIIIITKCNHVQENCYYLGKVVISILLLCTQ